VVCQALHAVAPSDTQQTDTYYIVAHFHYVLFGGMVFGLFSGFYYWWPKVFGKMLNEKLGSWNFWFMVIGMNLTFGPMHILGLQGQPRRMYVWTKARGGEGIFTFGFWNMVSTIGSFVLSIGVLFFIINVIKTARNPNAHRLTLGMHVHWNGSQQVLQRCTTLIASQSYVTSMSSSTASM